MPPDSLQRTGHFYFAPTGHSHFAPTALFYELDINSPHVLRGHRRRVCLLWVRSARRWCGPARVGVARITGRSVGVDMNLLKARIRVAFLSSLALSILFVCVSLSAQTNTGRILGTVTDQSGAAIAGATVVVTNVQTGVARDLTTDNAGEYVAPNLLPGTYAVRATTKGFQTIDRQDILLETGKDARVDIQLVPGEVTQTVEVTGAVPLVDTTNATLGGTLSNQTVNDLPLNGRNYQNLLSLRPGVTIFPGGGFETQSTNGLRVEDQNYVIDGLDNDEAFESQSVINSVGTAGDAATILPIDAIQEFNVEQNPKAESGWKPGSIVNVGLKSGTNNLHGSAYAFGRDDSFDARNYFDAAPQAKTPISLQQFGGTVGGHIIKDKLFYFAAYEDQRYDVGNSFTLTVPTTMAGVGPGISIPDAEAQLAAHNVAVSPLSVKLLPLFLPNSGPTGTINGGFPNTNQSDNVLGKVDYNINAHHTISGSYFYGYDTNTSEDTIVQSAQWLSRFTVRSQAVAGHWTWTPTSAWANEARFGVTRFNRPLYTVDHTVPPTHYGINTGVTNPTLFGLPQITFEGLTGLGGNINWPLLTGPNTNYDFVDHLSYLRGKHAFKFGGEIRDAVINQGSWQGGRGRFRFTDSGAFPGSTSLEDFLAGVPNNATLAVGSPQRNMTQWRYAGFVEDNWRITSKVTLDLGLRYEYASPWSAENNLLGNWEPTVGLEQVGKQISSAYKGDHTNFAPRVGVAWDVTGKGTTIIRAGGGIYYELLQATVFINEGNTGNAKTAGLSVIPTGATFVLPDGTVQQGSGTIATTALTIPGPEVNWTLAGPVLPASSVICGSGGSTGAPCSILAVDRNLRTPFVDTWMLDLQHAFSSNLSLEAAYIGNHGDRLIGITDVNQLNPQSPAEIACGQCEATAHRPYGIQYPYLQFINYVSNLDRSNYSGLQMNLTARNFHRNSFVAGYTYSHALDEQPNNSSMILPQDSLNPGALYGNAGFDIRRRFTLSWTYNLPEKKMRGQLLEGWTINSIVTLQSGLPWDVVDRGDDISQTGEFNDRWDFFGNPNDFKAIGASGIPCFGTGGGFAGNPLCGPTVPSACVTAAQKVDGGPSGPTSAALAGLGCYMSGHSVMIPPAFGTFGTMGRDILRDTGFRNLDFSLFKNWKFKERLTAQFRAEFFNVFNHPSFANPGLSGFSDPSGPGLWGCGCATPDVAATNPVLGSGSNRAIQLGLKLLF